MRTPSIGRLALFLWCAGLTLGLIAAFLSRDGESRRGPAADAESRLWAEEAARRDEALSAELAALRGELVALQDALRRSAGTAPGAAPALGERTPIEPLSPAGRAADAPEFELRRQLLDRFHTLEGDDREEALERLAELARWGDAEALDLVVESLKDASPEVRAQALKELVSLDPANLPAYLRAALDDPSETVREVVANRLDKLPAEEGGPLLVGLLRDSSPDVVIEAIKSLGELEYAKARPALLETLRSEDLDVATRAAQTLVKLGDPGAASATIQRLLADFERADVPGRIDDVKRLRRLRAARELEHILATDQSLAVREEAREALVRIEG